MTKSLFIVVKLDHIVKKLILTILILFGTSTQTVWAWNIFTYCSCIQTARSEGVDIPYGTDAEDLIANSSPAIGSLILSKYWDSKDKELIYHVSKIIAYTQEGFYVVEGGRFNGICQRRYRVIAYNDDSIYGFWHEFKGYSWYN